MSAWVNEVIWIVQEILEYLIASDDSIVFVPDYKPLIHEAHDSP
jgi:hypothetical protein